MNSSTSRRNDRNDEELVIDLVPVFKALRKHIILILAVALLFGAATWIGTHAFVTPTYRTSFRVYVNNSQDSSEKTTITSSDLSASRSLANTYAEIISGRTVLTKAAEMTGIFSGYSAVKNMVNVSTSNTTEIITVSVTTNSPDVSLKLAENIIVMAEEQVAGIVDGSSMRVIDEPYLPTGIYSPHYNRDAAIGAMIGLMLMVLIIALIEILDTRVRNEDSLEERYGIAILGSIPNQESARKSGGSYYAYGYARASEKGDDTNEK